MCSFSTGLPRATNVSACQRLFLCRLSVPHNSSEGRLSDWVTKCGSEGLGGACACDVTAGGTLSPATLVIKHVTSALRCILRPSSELSFVDEMEAGDGGLHALFQVFPEARSPKPCPVSPDIQRLQPSAFASRSDIRSQQSVRFTSDTQTVSSHRKG